MKLSKLFRTRNLCIFFATVFITVALCAVFAVYFLPDMLKPYLEERIGEATGSEVNIGLIKIEPFKLAIAVRDFSIENSTGKLAWDSVYIDAQLSSIFSRSVRLDELLVNNFHARLVWDDETRELPTLARFIADTFLRIMNRPLYIKRLTIHDGKFEGVDKRDGAERHYGLTPVSFTMERFSTQYSAGEGNNFNLQFSDMNGGLFRWNGNLQWDPFLSEGDLEIRGLNIVQFEDFYRMRLPFAMKSGTLDIRTAYRIVQDPEFGFVLHNATATLNRPTLIGDNEDFEMSAATVRADSLYMSTLDRAFFANEVRFDSVQAQYTFDSLPGLPEADFFKNIRFDENALAELETDDELQKFVNIFSVLNAWKIDVNSIVARRVNMVVTDSTTAPATVHNINDMELWMRQFSNHDYDLMPISAKARFNGSDLELDGTARLFPVLFVWNFDVKNYWLPTLQNYLSRETWLTLRQGRANSKFTMRWQPAAGSVRQDTLVFTGNAEVDTINLLGRNNVALVRARRATVGNAQLMVFPTARLQVNSVDVQAPVANVVLYGNNRNNFSQINRTRGRTPTPYQINRVRFSGGAIHLTDRTPATPFNYRILSVNGNVRNLTSQRRNAEITLTGRSGGYAPFSLNGTFNLAGRHPAFNVNVEAANQDLTVFSPYSGKHLGYRIARGQIAFKANYDVRNNRIKGDNNIVIRHLRFGESVESEDATRLPVRLAAALLSDRNGVIDLDVAVEGDLDDPTFSIGSIFWRVVRNLLGRAATAPFRSLMALVGSNADPENITFTPGSVQLTGEHTGTLISLSQALTQRPQVRLDVHGNADPVQDERALKETQLTRRLARNMGGAGNLTPASFERGAPRDTLFAEYSRIVGNDTWRTALQSDTPENLEAVLVQNANRIWNELVGRETLPPDALRNLAHTRAQNIKIEMVKIDAALGERIFVVDHGSLSSNTVNLRLREF